ncbi:MAG TPA: AAA domain-containing protein [Candidatus Dormibacteraeota bacterium]|jgi:very-short-patch-repair endonuclease|nr:AAA domain-containing protein [Candidatus Dormibacteraeota bacterium]
MVVGKAKLPDPPAVPTALINHLDRPHASDPMREPRLRTEATERTWHDENASLDVASELDAWLESTWRPWAESARPAFLARRLYEDLYDLRLRLQREEAVTELVWGHGLLAWQVGTERVLHPLITARMRLRFEPESGDIVVIPEDAGRFGLEIDVLQGLGVKGFDLLVDRRDRFWAEPIDPWEPDVHELYEQLLHPLGLDGQLLEGDRPAAATPAPVITATWALIVRRRSTLYRRFFQGLSEALRTVDATVPAPLAAVVTDEPSKLDGEEDEWRAVGERLLLPLPANAEQEAIAMRLAKHRGVTVQGPPGTGKTHTIANLVSHLIAHGKRVLVTSHKEQPLEVLREKIPEPIRDLCVSVLGTSSTALGQLERSVQAIYEQAVALDRDAARRDIERLRTELDAGEREVARLRNRIWQTVERESEKYRLGEREYEPSELGRWLAAQAGRLSFIPDQLDPDTPSPLGSGEVAHLFRLAQAIAPEDQIAVKRRLPDADVLLAGSELRARWVELTELRGRLVEAERLVEGWSAIDALSVNDFDQLIRWVDWAVARLQELSAPWLSTLRHEVARSAEWYAYWRDHCKFIRERIGEISRSRSLVAGHEIVLPDGGLPSKQSLADLHALGDRFATGKSVSRLFQKELAALQTACRVDGEPPRTLVDVKLLLAAALLRRWRYELVIRWNDEASRVGGTLVDPASAYPEYELDQPLGRLEAAIVWEYGDWGRLRERLQEAAVRSPERPTVDDLADLASILRLARTRFTEREVARWLNSLREYLRGNQRASDASPLWEALAAALETRQWDVWDEARGEAVRLARLRGDAEVLDQLMIQLAGAAPRWAARIVQSRGDASVCGSQDLAEEAWRWRQAETWLDRLIQRDDSAELQRQLEARLRRVSDLTTRLAAASAWLAVAEQLTDTQRQALTAWAQALKKVGKGTGKYAAQWRGHAQRAMERARGAVPVWVMPTYRVVESFNPADEPFDVVIVDESSQCDIFSLAVLGIARKAVVVGDDQQISPQAIGVNQDAVHELIAQHISDLPNAALLDVTSSLYDVAKRMFPGVIMLKEHFRCLPEIIQFSNDLAYDGQILPLREESTDPDWQPVVDLLVADGYRQAGTDVNPPEADAIVDAVVAMCDDPRYAAKTIGVISLLGEAQAFHIESRLIDRLGEREMERRRLRCGNAYHFQGDERDVMLLSLVVATGDRRIGAMNKNADRQRVNVAASRARDQLWCVHSVVADQLHPDDVRARLLRFCRDPHRAVEQYTDLADKCDSDFERAVLRRLLNRGFTVLVQHRVGRFRIDLVVRGRRNRLAIECDGDAYHGPEQWEADRRRQEILERLGWSFFRIRGSAFYRDPEAALGPLWERLDMMEIAPWAPAAETAAMPPAAEPPLDVIERPTPAVTWPVEDDIQDETDDNLDDVEQTQDELEVDDPSLATKVQALDRDDDLGRVDAESSETVTRPELAPFVAWASHSLPDAHTVTASTVADGLVEIVSAEGPMLAARAYELYVRASGGQRVGKALRQTLNRAAAAAIRAGRIAAVDGDAPGQINKTLYMPNTPSVIPRQRGDRQLEQIPVTEVAEVLRRLRAAGVAGHHTALKRAVLQVYERSRLTASAAAFLDRCLREAGL